MAMQYFPKDDLVALANDEVVDGYELIERVVDDVYGRVTTYDVIFKHADKLWSTFYHKGTAEHGQQPYDRELPVAFEVVLKTFSQYVKV